MKKIFNIILSSIVITGCDITTGSSLPSDEITSNREDIISNSEEIISSNDETISSSYDISFSDNELISKDEISSNKEISSNNDTESELLKDNDFSLLSSWTLYPSSSDKLSVISNGNGSLVIDINNSSETEYWGVQVLQNGLLLSADKEYEISFKIKSEVSRDIKFLLQSTDYSIYAIEETISLKADQTYSYHKKVTISSATSYLFGFMLGNVNGTLSGNHTITISSPSCKGQESYVKSDEGIDGTTTSAPSTKKGRNLVWSDEFNDNTLDTSIWSYDIGTGDWGWGNNEQQYYTSRETNIKESNGSLKIIARKEQYGSSNYTSGRILTKGKKVFKYGYFEARIAVPSSLGIWPAFWMLGANINEVSWPKCGEIDIMEAVNYNNVVYSTLHWNSLGSGVSDQVSHDSYGNGETGGYLVDDRTDYHLYALEWDENYIKSYVDDVQVFSMNISSIDAFHKEHYFLFNVAVGGEWPGYSIGNDFPQAMSIDYLRVYQ